MSLRLGKRKLKRIDRIDDSMRCTRCGVPAEYFIFVGNPSLDHRRPMPDVQFERFGKLCLFCRYPRYGEVHGFRESETDAMYPQLAGRVPSAQIGMVLAQHTPLQPDIAEIVCEYHTPDQRHLLPWSPESVLDNPTFPLTRIRYPAYTVPRAFNLQMSIHGIDFIVQEKFPLCIYPPFSRPEYESVYYDSRWFPTAPKCKCMRYDPLRQFPVPPCACWHMCCQIMRVCAVAGLDKCRFNFITQPGLHAMGGRIFDKAVFYLRMSVAVEEGEVACSPCSECEARGYKFE